jgi:hypothetical protein
LLTTYNLPHTVNFETGIQNNSSSAIDKIFVDNGRINLSSISPMWEHPLAVWSNNYSTNSLQQMAY